MSHLCERLKEISYIRLLVYNLVTYLYQNSVMRNICLMNNYSTFYYPSKNGKCIILGIIESNDITKNVCKRMRLEHRNKYRIQSKLTKNIRKFLCEIRILNNGEL